LAENSSASGYRDGAVCGNHHADGKKEQGRQGNGFQHFEAYSMARGRDELREFKLNGRG
jgi:hypothetical protein